MTYGGWIILGMEIVALIVVVGYDFHYTDIFVLRAGPRKPKR